MQICQNYAYTMVTHHMLPGDAQENTTITVFIDSDIIELIPYYLASKRKDIETMQSLLQAGDYDQLEILSDYMVGDGGSYGFNSISMIGRELLRAIDRKDNNQIHYLLIEVSHYLDRVIAVDNTATVDTVI
jgi:hypothetical protein